MDYHTCSPDISHLGGISLFSYYKYEQTNDAQVQEYVNPVIARAGGFIVAVKFEENQNVKKATHFSYRQQGIYSATGADQSSAY